VLLISGCQDRQLSGEAAGHGLFTRSLLDVWNEGVFTGSYTRLHSKMLQQMPDNQTPNLFESGRKDTGFISQRPFMIDP
jgi:hypothetical protein